MIIDSGSLSAEILMAKDAELLVNLDPTGPLQLHFYQWKGPSVTYGYFTDPALHLNMEAVEHYGLELARRPTGGGIIFHLTDFAFSVLVPAQHAHFSLNTLENYAWINQKVIKAIAGFTSEKNNLQLLQQESLCLSRECHSFCMAKPTQYDVLMNGKKVGGAAQRRTKHGLLHQSSLSLLMPPVDLLKKVLKNGPVVLEAMQQQSDFLCPPQTPLSDLSKIREVIRGNLKHVFIEYFNQ